jgi:ABC-type multidrug transport system fused ATPase/permease subunit
MSIMNIKNTPLNPWTSIWLRPKETMRHILNNYPTKSIHLLAILGAFTYFVGSIHMYFGSWFATIISWICFSIIGGLVMLYLFGALFKWTGNWIGGQGTYQELMSVIAWTQIPVICFFVVEMIILALVRGNTLSLFYSIVRFALGIVAFIIFLFALSEGQKFSIWKAIINYVLSLMILFVALLIISVIISLF